MCNDTQNLQSVAEKQLLCNSANRQNMFGLNNHMTPSLNHFNSPVSPTLPSLQNQSFSNISPVPNQFSPNLSTSRYHYPYNFAAQSYTSPPMYGSSSNLPTGSCIINGATPFAPMSPCAATPLNQLQLLNIRHLPANRINARPFQLSHRPLSSNVQHSRFSLPEKLSLSTNFSPKNEVLRNFESFGNVKSQHCQQSGTPSQNPIAGTVDLLTKDQLLPPSLSLPQTSPKKQSSFISSLKDERSLQSHSYDSKYSYCQLSVNETNVVKSVNYKRVSEKPFSATSSKDKSLKSSKEPEIILCEVCSLKIHKNNK